MCVCVCVSYPTCVVASYPTCVVASYPTCVAVSLSHLRGGEFMPPAWW